MVNSLSFRPEIPNYSSSDSNNEDEMPAPARPRLMPQSPNIFSQAPLFTSPSLSQPLPINFSVQNQFSATSDDEDEMPPPARPRLMPQSHNIFSQAPLFISPSLSQPLPINFSVSDQYRATHIVGTLNGHNLLEITSNGKQYVVYERNRSAPHLVAMPYYGLHTLRSIQTIASAVLGLLSAGLAAKTALIFKATVLSTSVIAGIAGTVIFGIGMIYTWYYNDQDPTAQLEIRTKQLRDQTIDLNHFTTAKEKRSFFFTKPYSDIRELAGDFGSLLRLNLLTRDEIPYYNDIVLSNLEKYNELMDQNPDTYRQELLNIQFNDLMIYLRGRMHRDFVPPDSNVTNPEDSNTLLYCL